MKKEYNEEKNEESKIIIDDDTDLDDNDEDDEITKELQIKELRKGYESHSLR